MNKVDRIQSLRLLHGLDMSESKNDTIHLYRALPATPVCVLLQRHSYAEGPDGFGIRVVDLKFL